MSSYMIDENKNLVSDKLWEFFATPWSKTAPELSTIRNVEVGEVFQAICSNFGSYAYAWDRAWTTEDMFLFKLNNADSSTSGPFELTQLQFKGGGIFQILQKNNEYNQVQLRSLIAKEVVYDNALNIYFYNKVSVVGIRLS